MSKRDGDEMKEYKYVESLKNMCKAVGVLFILQCVCVVSYADIKGESPEQYPDPDEDEEW